MLVERASAPRQGGYMLWGAGYDVAERRGLLSDLRRRGYRVEELWLVDERGERIAGFDANTLRSATGDRFLSVPRANWPPASTRA